MLRHTLVRKGMEFDQVLALRPHAARRQPTSGVDQKLHRHGLGLMLVSLFVCYVSADYCCQPLPTKCSEGVMSPRTMSDIEGLRNLENRSVFDYQSCLLIVLLSQLHPPCVRIELLGSVQFHCLSFLRTL